MLWLSGAAVLVGYLLGSLPTAYLVSRRASQAILDIRLAGDGNVGAGNIGRVLGRRWGLLVGAVDIAKGVAPVFILNLVANIASLDEPEGTGKSTSLSGPGMLAGVSAIGGHIWPLWLRFRGGRGAATALGVTAAALTGPVLLMAVPALVMLWMTRSTTLTLAFIYIASIVVAKAVFDISWWPIWYCVAIFIGVGLVHFWTLKFRPTPATETAVTG